MQVEAVERETRDLMILIDSGAFNHVCPKKLGARVTMQPWGEREASKIQTADGAEIRPFGQEAGSDTHRKRS